MTSSPSPRARPRWVASGMVLAAIAAPLAAGLSGAAVAATTPEAILESTTPTTPLVTTPVDTTPPTVTPNILGPGGRATATWTVPEPITEDAKLSVTLSGEIDGQATAHVALVKGAPNCQSSPLYPKQIASGTRVAVTSKGPVPITTPPTLGATFTGTASLTPRDSGAYRLCGWLVGFPSSSEASTVAQLDQAVTVGNRTAVLNAEIPETSRSGDYFSVKLSGNNPGAGRRALVMAEANKGQSCATMVKAASGKRPLQSVVGLPSGDYTKTLRLRYRTKTAGPHLLCIQIVETVDRTPEAAAARVMTVTEGLKCVNTQTALAQRSSDLTVVRKRRDASKDRLAAAKKKVAPAKKKLSAQTKTSNKRIASARKAVKRAKSKAAKRSANKRLASVRKAEKKKIYKAGAPLRSANASVRMHQRSYNQYRTGANLLMDTIARTKKDLKKYCAAP